MTSSILDRAELHGALARGVRLGWTTDDLRFGASVALAREPTRAVAERVTLALNFLDTLDAERDGRER